MSVTSSTAIEDGPAFRLPLTITLNDTSENVKNLKLDSSDLSEVLYLTRLQNVSLDGFNDSLNGISFDNNFLSSPELVIRFSNNFKSSLETISLEQQIKTLFEAESDVSSKVSNVESLFQSFGLNKNTHWSFYAKGQTLDSNGVEETVFEQLDYNENFIRSNSVSNLENKEYVENSISSDFMTKVGDVFTIDIQQLASNISPNGASQDIIKEAQIWLSGKLGGKVNPDTSSSFDVNVTVITEDNDNIDSNFSTSLFSDRTLLGQTQQTLSVNFVETNDLPVVTNVDNDMIYHEGGDHVLLITNAVFSDEDNTNFNGGTISAKLNSPISGDNIFIFNSASITLSGTGDIIDGQNVVGVKDANDIVIGQLQKLFSDDGRDVIGFNVTLNEEADANDITAILHSIGYSNSGTISDVRDVSYKVSIEDGSGPDINGNASTEITGNIVTINPQPSGEYIEGNTLASNDVTETTINLFDSINLSDNGYVPDQIQLNVKDFILGDIISTSSTLVSSSYDNQTGVLTLTSPVGSSDAEKLASFHDGINKSTYSSTNDNPTQLFVDQEHSITNERIIEIKSIDNSSSLTVDEGRTVGTFKVNITSNDDLPDFNLNNFKTVKFAPQEITTIVDGQEVTVNELRSSSTQLLPDVLVEDNDQDALGLTIYGSSSSKIFDPDSLINEVMVEITSTDPNSEIAAKSQDKLTFKPSSDNLFTVIGEEGKPSLTISLSQEVTDTQTNSSNQLMLENALRSVYYENEAALSEIISGFRDVKITIKDIEGISTVIYDSKNVAEDDKILNIGSNVVDNNNILPSITGIDNQVSFHEGTEHIFLISEGTIIDQNDTNFSGGVLKISLISPFEGEKDRYY